MGDLIFASLDVVRKLKFHPETILNKANRKFSKRWKKIEKLIKINNEEISKLNINKLNYYWEKIKNNYFFLKNIRKIIIEINNKRINRKFDENKSFILKYFNSTKLEISLPIKAAKNIIGIKPINVVIINFILEIFNIERHMF